MERLPESLRHLWPHEPRWHATDAGRLHYVDLGPPDAAPVLLVHGNPSWGFLWRDLGAELVRRGRRVIIPDHVGMGLSDRPDLFLRLEDRIRHLGSLVDALGLRDIDLGVHDWGGAIGLGLAGRQPGRFRRLLATNTAAWPSTRIPLRIALCRAPAIGRFLVQRLDGFAWPATWMSTVRPLRSDIKAGFLAPYGDTARRRAVADFVADIPMEPGHPSRAALESVSRNLDTLAGHPALLLWGARDFCFTPRFADELARRWPRASRVLLPDAGHYLLEDGGAEAVEIAADFLA
jgi:cis-3-alkyl-4-acyloxetan-2-one decarboxylase